MKQEKRTEESREQQQEVLYCSRHGYPISGTRDNEHAPYLRAFHRDANAVLNPDRGRCQGWLAPGLVRGVAGASAVPDLEVDQRALEFSERRR